MKSKTPKVEWPILILRGDGNIYILCAGVDTERPRLQGPVSFLPQVQDNYGVDSCGILVMPTLPPAIIIAESSGKLHHALLLESEAEKNKNTVSFIVLLGNAGTFNRFILFSSLSLFQTLIQLY